eukprot:jgi/Chlat1/3423/Chrsp23S03751
MVEDEADEEEVGKAIQLTWERRARRPGYGRAGRAIKVYANFYPVAKIPDGDIYHYDVSVVNKDQTNKPVANKALLRSIMEVVQNSNEYRSTASDILLAFDGVKNAYTAIALPVDPVVLPVELPPASEGRPPRRYAVTLKLAASVRLIVLQEYLRGQRGDIPQAALQALDIAARMTASHKYWIFGRSFYDPTFGSGDLGNGLNYTRGFFQSLRPVQAGLALNLDMSATAVFKPINVVDFIAETLGRRLDDLRGGLRGLPDALKVRKILKGMRVEVTHRGQQRRKFRITGLSPNPADAQTFVLEDQSTGQSREVTVAKYFMEQYHYQLQYPKLPCANSSTNPNKPTYFPLEVLKIVEGQRHLGKLSAAQVTALLKAQCQRPDVRKNDIDRVYRECRFGADPYTRQFGLQLSANMLECDARILPVPQLQYKNNVLTPRPGNWNMVGQQVLQPGRPITTWVAVIFDRLPPRPVYEFAEFLSHVASGMGIEIAPQLATAIQAGNAPVETILRRAVTAAEKDARRKPDLILAVMPTSKDSALYGDVKRICETVLDIPSQCVLAKWAGRPNEQYMANLLLKINVKMGGTNVALKAEVERKLSYISDAPTIVFGADVSHPPPGAGGASIASVVASMDWPKITRYRAITRAQPHRKEGFAELYRAVVIDGVPRAEGIVMDLLKAFYGKTRQKPARLIFYRDGVSEGQFKEVLYHELTQIRQACQAIEDGYMPYITFIVVQKRNHTRLFAKDQRDTTRSGNVMPGTCVDTKICSPWEHDFYLVAHEGIQGTSRVTHYYVLHDDNRFTPDGIQGLTNSLCYTYARATRSVSIVPPAYYAHLSAFRGRAYGIYSESDVSSVETGAGGSTQAFVPLPEVKPAVRDTMYFC